jgi:hypothetical protein
MLSPLAAISSSIGHWDGELTATAAATSCLPGFTIAVPEYDPTMPPSSYVPGFTPLVNSTISYDFFAEQNREPFGNASSLSVPEDDVDIDRTPRCADFPAGVQEQYTQYVPASPMHFASHSSYDLQSYRAALEDFDISTSSYELPAYVSSVPPSEDFRLDEFLTMGSY